MNEKISRNGFIICNFMTYDCPDIPQAKSSVAKPMKPEHAGENLDQPSPISVLEPPFEDYDNSVLESSSSNKPILRGTYSNHSTGSLYSFYVIILSSLVSGNLQQKRLLSQI